MAALQPTIRVGVLRTLVPAEAGTVLSLWSTKPLADASAFAEGRVVSISPITRRISTPDGDYEVATCDVELADHDAFMRGLLGSAVTRQITQREGWVELLSEAGRAAALAWRSLLRGRVVDVQVPTGRRSTVRIADEVGSHFSGFDLEKTLGVLMTRALFPDLPRESIGRIFPIVVGEHTDVGSVDANGDPNDRGMLPVVDMGWTILSDNGSPVPYDVAQVRLSPPTDLVATVLGTPGTRTLRYLVTAQSTYGETTGTWIVVTNAPQTLTDTDAVQLAWAPGAVGGASAYHVYRNGRRIVTLTNGDTYVDPETTWIDDGSEAANGPEPPLVNGAFIDQEIDGVVYSVWRMFALKIGAAGEVQHVYGSNLATDETPRRVRLDESVYGTQVLAPGRPGYPHWAAFTEVSGIRFAPLYARGPIADHHLRGVVTLTWNGCGDDATGDGTGATITEAFLQLQHVLNEYVLKGNGHGYRTGNYGPLETYSNGVAKLRTSAFAACQALTQAWIGGRGYQGALAITAPISLREFLRRFHVTFGSHGTSNHHGQFYPVLIDDTADPSAGRHYIDRVNVIRMRGQRYQHDHVERSVTFHFDWDAAANGFRYTDIPVGDPDETPVHGPRACYYSRDYATVLDAQTRHVRRYTTAPRYVDLEVDYTGLEDENGAQVRLTHYDGIGTSGDEATPCLVVGHTVSPVPPHSVVLTVLDLSPILATYS